MYIIFISHLQTNIILSSAHSDMQKFCYAGALIPPFLLRWERYMSAMTSASEACSTALSSRIPTSRGNTIRQNVWVRCNLIWCHIINIDLPLHTWRELGELDDNEGGQHDVMTWGTAELLQHFEAHKQSDSPSLNLSAVSECKHSRVVRFLAPVLLSSVRYTNQCVRYAHKNAALVAVSIFYKDRWGSIVATLNNWRSPSRAVCAMRACVHVCVCACMPFCPHTLLWCARRCAGAGFAELAWGCVAAVPCLLRGQGTYEHCVWTSLNVWTPL